MLAKLCIVGPKGVGKSTMVSRIDSSSDKESSGSPASPKFSNCNILIGDRTIDLQIYDISGEENLLCMAPIFFKGAKVALCVFDLTNEKSFEALGAWVKGIKENASDECILVIVGNKDDLEDQIISRERGDKFAESVGARYFQVSAVSGSGLLNVLVYIAKRLFRLNDCSLSYRAKHSIVSNSQGWCVPRNNETRKKLPFQYFRRSL